MDWCRCFCRKAQAQSTASEGNIPVLVTVGEHQSVENLAVQNQAVQNDATKNPNQQHLTREDIQKEIQKGQKEIQKDIQKRQKEIKEINRELARGAAEPQVSLGDCLTPSSGVPSVPSVTTEDMQYEASKGELKILCDGLKVGASIAGGPAVSAVVSAAIDTFGDTVSDCLYDPTPSATKKEIRRIDETKRDRFFDDESAMVKDLETMKEESR